MDRQCSSCGGFCKKSGCERDNVKPEPEPVAWMHIHGSHEDPCFCELTEDEISQGWTQKPLYYTTPPQREWVGVTNKEILADDVLRYHFGMNGGAGPVSKKGKTIIETIEAKLKEKNT